MKEIEQQLAANPEFISKAEQFHAVRILYDDPATSRVFNSIYRIPVLATMTYDFNQRQWRILDQILGPNVASDCIPLLEQALR
ncbi:MAG: hypothetical protein ACFCU1_14720 [Sumerlaeia bacterium]